MILPIVTRPNPILTTPTRPVSPAELTTEKIKKLIADMTDTMYAADGVGIAANQVNVNMAITVIAKKFAGTTKDLVLVNPVWKKNTRKQVYDTEGCLSVPGVTGEVKRYTEITVNALTATGKPIAFIAYDYLARIVQHETDHLNGILFIDKARKVTNIEM